MQLHGHGILGLKFQLTIHTLQELFCWGDIDNDGDMDVVTGNDGQQNRLYLNTGVPNDPWDAVVGMNITSDAYKTSSMVLCDIDEDGDLDLFTGNYNNQYNLFYENNGSTDPWNKTSGEIFSDDTHNTFSIAAGDVDGDGGLEYHYRK